MLKRLQYIILLVLALSNAILAAAQVAMPDHVYIGATKHYNVNPSPTSTYTWWIDGVEQVGNTAGYIEITWTTASPNPHLLEVQEHPANGCDGPKRSGEVFVSQLPALPPPFTECVKDLISATYNPATRSLDYVQPDHHTFIPGDTRLDLTNFTGNGDPACPFRIAWRIDFSPASDPSPPHSLITLPPLTGIGQPSVYGIPILLPGNGLEYKDVTHTITWWIENCNGNHIAELGNQTITIKPRPKIE